MTLTQAIVSGALAGTFTAALVWIGLTRGASSLERLRDMHDADFATRIERMRGAGQP